MMSTFIIFLILLSVNFLQLKGTNTTYRRCETEYRNGTIKLHCCDNYEDRNGICVGCETGYISDMGEPCFPCRNGLYGRKCGDKCQCDENEICDHVVGCTDELTQITLESASIQNSETSKLEPGTLGAMQTDTVIYVICTSCVTFVLTLCLVALNRYRRKRYKHLNVRHVMEKDNNENNKVNCNQEQNHYEKVYDTIDESKMIDAPGQHSIPVAERSSSSSIKDEFNLSDGYLNPYQPMVHDPDLHDYLQAKPLDEHDPNKHSNQDQDLATFRRLASTDEQELKELSTSEHISPSLFPEIETGMKCSDYVSMT